MSESFAELFEESLKAVEMEPGAIVTGTIVDIDEDWVTVHAGLKSEGVIPRSQFVDEKGNFELSIGDQVKVAMEAVDDGFGETRLSREKARRAEVWMVLEEAFEGAKKIPGFLQGKVKGGFTVDIDGIRAFLPGSLVDMRPVREVAHLEGKELEFKVIKLDQRRNNVVVSRRAVLEEENSVEREALLTSLAEGMDLKESSRTSRITVLSWILAGLTVCFTSPIWLGVVSSTRAKSSMLAMKSASAFSNLTGIVSAYPWASSSLGKIPGWRSKPATRKTTLWKGRSRTSRTTVASWRSKRAWKALCTFPRWTGPTRTSIPRRSCRWVMT